MSIAFIVFLVIFVLIFLLKMPIPLGLLAACTFYFLISGANTRLVAQTMLATLNGNYIVMAIPLYIFSANIMNNGTITERIFDFSKGIVGRFRGGLAHVNVLASLIFSGMTGSAVADAAGLGKLEIEAMRKEGYDDGFSCAVTAASATIGPIFPPSIPIIIFSTISGASVGALFMGGMIPGILLAVALMIFVALISTKRKYPRAPVKDIKAYLVNSFRSIPAILTPVILLIGIYTGVMTPTEAGAVAGLYALIISVFAYKVLKWKAFKELLIDTIKTSGIVCLMIGAAPVMSYVVAKEQIATRLSEWILTISSNPMLFLLFVNIFLLILGMVLSTSVIQLVVLPLLIPTAIAMGIDMVHFGILTTFNIMVGLSTPPYGMLLFVTSGISDTPLKKVIKEIIWPTIAAIAVLAIITYIPDIVLFLPRVLLGYNG